MRGLVELTNEIISGLENNGFDRDHPTIKKLYTLKTSLVGIQNQLKGPGDLND